MDIPRKDMLPDPQPVVEKDAKPQEPEAPAKQGDEQAPTVPPDPTGSHTPEPKLYAALSEERKLRKQAEVEAEEERFRRKELERKLKDLESTPDEPSELDEDPEKNNELAGEVRNLKSSLREIERRETRRELEAKFPQLAENRKEFDSFLEDEENSKLSLAKAAKLFLAEKGLLTDAPPRKGLEKPTGGAKVPTPKMSKADIKRLREEQPRRYIQMLRSGALNPDDIE